MDKQSLSALTKLTTKGNILQSQIKHLKIAISMMKNHNATTTINVGTADAYITVLGGKQMDVIVLDILEHDLLVAEMEFSTL